MAGKASSSSQNVRTSVHRRMWAIVFALILVLAVSFLGIRWWVQRTAPQTLIAAEELLKEGNNAGVEASLSWLLWFEPEHPRGLLLRGVSRNARRNVKEALDDLSRIPDNSSEFLEGGIALGATLIMDGQLDRAEDVLLRHLERYPGAIESRERLSGLYLTVLCHPEAMQLWENHWSMFPNDLSVLPRLFDIRNEVISPPQRLPYVTRMNEQHSGQERVLAALGTLNSMSGNMDSAEACFRQATAQPDSQPGSLLPAARFFLDTGNPQEAKKLLDRYSSAERPHRIRVAEYWHLVGRIEETAVNYELALAAFRRAVAAQSDDPVYQLACARTLRRLGRTEAAAAAAETAQQVSEDRERLRIMAKKIDRNRPSPDEFLMVSEILASLGIEDEARAWQQVSESLKQSGDQP